MINITHYLISVLLLSIQWHLAPCETTRCGTEDQSDSFGMDFICYIRVRIEDLFLILASRNWGPVENVWDYRNARSNASNCHPISTTCQWCRVWRTEIKADHGCIDGMIETTLHQTIFFGTFWWFKLFNCSTCTDEHVGNKLWTHPLTIGSSAWWISWQ